MNIPKKTATNFWRSQEYTAAMKTRYVSENRKKEYANNL